MNMVSIQKDTYEAAAAVRDRISAFLNVCQNTAGSWGPVYAGNCDSNKVLTAPEPTDFGVEWKEWMDTAVFTVAATVENNVWGVVAAEGDPILNMDSGTTPNDIARGSCALYAKTRGIWNGGTYIEYVPPV